jgi:RNA polymerase sigma-70 factor, ECF subfamily
MTRPLRRQGRAQPAHDAAIRTLESLIAASAHGDEEAFGQLYDLTAARVYGLVLRIIRDRGHAAEVTQEVYLEVWRQAARYNPSKSTALPWLLMITHRRAVDRVRTAQAGSDRDLRYAEKNVERAYDNTSETVERSLDAQRVRQALGQLTPVQREAITLAYFGGYSQTEIAGLVKAPVGTVKTRIRDALIRLRDALGVNS